MQLPLIAHKQALLFSIVDRHLDLILAVDAKMADIVSSRAIYEIAAEFDFGSIDGPGEGN